MRICEVGEMIVRETLVTRSGGKQVVMTPFNDYCDHLKVDVFKALGDVEAMCEMMTGQCRCDWTETEVEAYDKVRSRLLNLAGAVAR